VKYLEAFLAENQSGKDTKGIEPAKPAKGAFDGFAGATYRDIQAARQPLESASGFDATDVNTQNHGAEIRPDTHDEVETIIMTWRNLFGLKLDRGDVRAHLTALTAWQRQGLRR
jgi:hypothetical protein